MTLSELSALWRQKVILASILYQIDQLKVNCTSNIINYDDLDTMDDIFRKWNTQTYQAIIEADEYE